MGSKRDLLHTLHTEISGMEKHLRDVKFELRQLQTIMVLCVVW